MKALTLILLVLIVNSSAYLIKVPKLPLKPVIAPVEWVHVQKLLLPLFDNVCEESTNEIVVNQSQQFNLDASSGDYTKTDVLDNLKSIRTDKGFLPKAEIFSEYNPVHMNELKSLYEVFYYAADFDTFYKAACWARQNMNCGLFVDALYLAIINRKDTSNISIPPPYELLPNYFLQRDTIIKASTLLAESDATSVDGVTVENNAYIVETNYTTDANNDDDSKLAYFREDVGLNSYYFLRKLKSFHSANTFDSNSNHGELIFTMMKDLAARYDLERYSNGLPELESLDWSAVIPAYNPMLIYSNGNEFGHRTHSDVLSENDDVAFMKTIETNFGAVVTHLRQAGRNKTQILNHLIEILTTANRNYETVATHLLGNDMGVTDRQYSTLEHYLTSVRDPVFWKINKKMVEMINDGLQVLPKYDRSEIYFPGVQILNVETKKMITTFDTFQFDVTDSLKQSDSHSTFQVKIVQKRLNHKPFTVKLNISSVAVQKGVIKIFLGPKTLPGKLLTKKNQFVQMDKFEYEFKRGINIISRTSEEMKGFSNDFVSLNELRKKVEYAEFGLYVLDLKDITSQIGYPSRLILPKGLTEGLPLQLFIFVAPIYKPIVASFSISNREFNSAVLSPGYPLDLALDEKILSNLPNVHIKDIIVTHKDESKGSGYSGKKDPTNWNSNKSYSSRSYSSKDESFNDKVSRDDVVGDEHIENEEFKTHDLLNDRPEFTFKNKDKINYADKRNQYNNKKNYPSTPNNYKNQNYESNFKKSNQLVSFEENGEEEKINSDSKEEVKSDTEHNFAKVVHGLLRSLPAYIHKVDERNQYIRKQADVFNKKETNKYSYQEKTIKTANNTDRKEQSKEMSGEKMDNNDKSFLPPEKIHSLLGGTSDNINKNKEKSYDFTKKKDQYKKKIEKYETKRAQYKKEGSLKNETEEENDAKQTEPDNQLDLTTSNYSSKYIVIDDGNSMIIKNIYDGESIKDIDSGKREIAKELLVIPSSDLDGSVKDNVSPSVSFVDEKQTNHEIGEPVSPEESIRRPTI